MHLCTNIFILHGFFGKQKESKIGASLGQGFSQKIATRLTDKTLFAIFWVLTNLRKSAILIVEDVPKPFF